MEWAIEAAKQVPALAVLVWVVVHFLTHIAKGRDLSEQRIKDICDSHAKQIESMHNRETSMLTTVSSIIATNNEVLGSIKTLLSMQVSDERNERTKHPRRHEAPDKP
jgi:hypothetical protein